jgi:hypothetical protein
MIFENLDDGFYPDKEDCRKFHVCYSGTQSIRWCKEGMLWDETKIGCNMQNSTICTGGRKKWGRNEGLILIKNFKKGEEFKFRCSGSWIKISER